jgi:aldehyde:ferredoxin oxidoreductase
LTPEKVRFAYLTQCFYSMMDSLTLCQFVYGPTWCLYGPNDTARMVKAVTGWDVTVDELLELGHRRISLMRTFNAREGFERKDDKLPKKFFKPLVGVGPSSGVVLSHEEMDAALDEYYDLAGCTKNGIPTQETLKALDIEWAADYLPA